MAISASENYTWSFAVLDQFEKALARARIIGPFVERLFCSDDLHPGKDNVHSCPRLSQFLLEPRPLLFTENVAIGARWISVILHVQ